MISRIETIGDFEAPQTTHRGHKKALTIGLLSTLYFGALLYIVDLTDLAHAFGRIATPTLAFALSLIVFAKLVAFARFIAVLGVLGFRPAWRDAFVAFSAGNISNLPFNVVGQSITRAMVLKRAGVPVGATVMTTYVERVLAAVILLFLSLVGLWILFGDIEIELYRGGGDVLTLLCGIVIVVGTVGWMVLTSRGLFKRGLAYAQRIFRLWPSAVLTFFVHGAGLFGYLVLFRDLDPHRGISLALIAALVIVMFVTSLPISFAGWGIRELSAVSVLGVIGMPPENSVAAAVAMGSLYLVATGLFGAVCLIPTLRRNENPAVAASWDNAGATRLAKTSVLIGENWDAAGVKVCALLCAILIFFRIPTQFEAIGFPVNVNVADVIVFVGLSVVALMIAAGKIRTLFSPSLSTFLAICSAVVIVGLAISYAHNNLGPWALYNRGVGWILMLGYAALGAAMVRLAGNAGRMLIVRSLIVAALTICVLQLLILAWSTVVGPVPEYVLTYPLDGFANNRNAFAFDLAMAGTLLIVGRNAGLFGTRRWLFVAALAVLATTLYLTESRTGAVFVVLLALLDRFSTKHWVKDRFNRSMSRATLLAAILIVAAIFLPYVVRFGAEGLQSLSGIDVDANALFTVLAQPDREQNTRLIHQLSDAERWETIVGGLRLWLDGPLFGAGLGAYWQSLLASGHRAQGIHSIYVWILAEMGLVGVCLVMVTGVRVAAGAWRMMSAPLQAPWGFSILAILSLLAVGGLVQDLSFQRIFWFLLGLSAADVTVADRSWSAKAFLAIVVVLSLMTFFLAI